MKFLRYLLPTFLIALPITLLLSTACGLITAPYSVPAAVAENTFFNLTGPLVDSSGNPLDGVLLSQQLDHRYWEPMMGSTDTDEHKLRRFDKTYAVHERGKSLNLTVTHDGYADASYIIQADEPHRIHSHFGDWPLTDNFPIVLLPNVPPQAKVIGNRYVVDYSKYPRASVMHLLKYETPNRNVADAATFIPGALYLTLEKQTPVAINAKGDLDPVDVNLPAHITLHIAGPNGGFIPIAPRSGYPPLQTTDTAPTTGYVPELTIPRARLKDMRKAALNDIVEAHEYFFYLADGHYGKGSISFNQTFGKYQTGVMPLAFTFELFTQPQPNDTNLTLRSDHIDCPCPK